MIKFQKSMKNDIPRLYKIYLKGIEKYFQFHVFWRKFWDRSGTFTQALAGTKSKFFQRCWAF